MEQLCVGCFAKPPSYHHRQLSPTSPTVAAVITTTATTTTTTTIISSTSNVATTVTTSLPPPFQPHLPQPPPQPPPHQHHYQHHHPLHHSHHSPHHYHHHHHSSPATTRMKARQFARRFSLQPFSLTREDSSEAPGTSDRIPGVSGPGSGGGPGGGGGGGGGVGASCHDRGSASSAGGAVGGSCPGGKPIQDDRKRRYRVVIMGAARVGKTAIINQFLYDTFTPKYTRTVEEMHHGEYEVSGMALTLDILDTSGSYEFPAMRELSINTADAFILVYAINDAESFEEVRNLRDYILKTKQKDVPLVVVGNKNDLEADRAVPYEKAETIVSLDWENGFLETSAKDNLGVLHVFKELLNQAKIRYALSPAVKRRRQSMPNVGGMQITPAQLSHLKHISKRSSSSKRNSCVIA